MKYSASEIGKVLNNALSGIMVVYPNVAPQKVGTPYCVYNILTNEPEDVKENTSWVDNVNFLLSTYSDTYSEASNNAERVRFVLDGLRTIYKNVNVDSVVFVTESDDFDPDTLKHIKIQEYRIRILNTRDMITQPKTISADYEFTDVIPAGYAFHMIVVRNASVNTVTLKVGTSADSSDVALIQNLLDGEIQSAVSDMVFSKTSAQSIYIYSDNWNNASIEVTFKTERIY